VKAGLGDVSRWTGAHKTSCRAYLRALASKLAIEEAETFNASAGKEGARVYRVYSSEAILERRRTVGFTHVIRTGAVTFVDPATGSKLLSDSNLPPD
jgi:putative heme degradation protein